MQNITVIFFLATIFSCSDNQTNTDKNITAASEGKKYTIKPLEIDNGEEEGWSADIRLSIVSKSENDTANIFKAVSSYNGHELGLLVSVGIERRRLN